MGKQKPFTDITKKYNGTILKIRPGDRWQKRKLSECQKQWQLAKKKHRTSWRAANMEYLFNMASASANQKASQSTETRTVSGVRKSQRNSTGQPATATSENSTTPNVT